MSFVVFTLTASSLCLYFAFATGFDAFSSMYAAAVAAVVLGSVACACGCAAAKRDRRLRFLFIPLPCLALLLAHSGIEALILAPAVVYSAAILLSARFAVTHYSFSNHLRGSGIALPIFLLVHNLVAVDVAPAILFSTVWLVLGVFTLRQLRAGVKTGPKQKAMELLSLSAVPAGIGLFLVVTFHFREMVDWLGKRIFYPLAQLILGIIDLLTNYSPEEIVAETETATETIESTAAASEEAIATTYAPKPVPSGEDHVDKIVVALLLLVFTVVMICLLIWILRRLRESRTEAELEAWKQPETADDGKNIRGRVREKPERYSNRRRVRRSYEQYLELLRKRRFIRLPQHSSEDILEKTRELTSEEPAEALRELYIQARYDPEAEVTGAEVREAKRLVKELRERDP